jgi:hypothetical protein
LIVYVCACVFAESAFFSLSALRSYPAAPHGERKIKRKSFKIILKMLPNRKTKIGIGSFSLGDEIQN